MQIRENKAQQMQARAEAAFKRKEDQARDGAAAMAEYKANTRAVEQKTARLKALRLAKEAADLDAASSLPPPAPAQRRKKTAP